MKDISYLLRYVCKSSSCDFSQTEDIVQVEKHVTSEIVIWKHVIIHDSHMQAGTSLFQQLRLNITGIKEEIDYRTLKWNEHKKKYNQLSHSQIKLLVKKRVQSILDDLCFLDFIAKELFW